MDEPEPGVDYRLVRREGQGVLLARFIRYDDGSGRVVADGWHTAFELDQATWRRHWDSLMERGYVELGEALKAGYVVPSEVPA